MQRVAISRNRQHMVIDCCDLFPFPTVRTLAWPSEDQALQGRKCDGALLRFKNQRYRIGPPRKPQLLTDAPARPCRKQTHPLLNEGVLVLHFSLLYGRVDHQLVQLNERQRRTEVQSLKDDVSHSRRLFLRLALLVFRSVNFPDFILSPPLHGLLPTSTPQFSYDRDPAPPKRFATGLVDTSPVLRRCGGHRCKMAATCTELMSVAPS